MPEIVKTNPVSSPTQKPVKTHSKFSPDYSRYDSHVFGLNTPHFVMEGVADDDISMRSTCDVDTFNLKAPLMQPVRRNMDYFQLPLRCLLPHGAELLITNPLQGDDVDPEQVNSVVSAADLKFIVTTFTRGLLTPIADTNFIDANIASLIRAWQYFDTILSHGSLPKYLGYNFPGLFGFHIQYGDAQSNSQFLRPTYEQVFDAIFSYIDECLVDGGFLQVNLSLLEFDPPQYGTEPFNPQMVHSALQVAIGTPNMPFDMVFPTFRSFLEFLGDSPYMIGGITDYMVTPASLLRPASQTPLYELMGSVYFLRGNFPGTYVNASYDEKTPVKNENFLRLVAYQKACAEFYTNDKVDGIYSAALYDSNQLAIFRYIAGQALNAPTYYNINGVPVEFDAMSGAALHTVITRLQMLTLNPYQDAVATALAWYYMHNLFSFTRSLKYEDYLVSAKTRPLAVGDVSVGVDTGTNTVDVIDVTTKIQVQRFLNQVNRIGRKFSDYVKGILGDKPMKDVHEPIFLGHVVDTFGAEETNNTGDGQLSLANSTTSKLRNNSSRFGFDVHCGEPSILIGITNYDIPRAYTSITERQNFHVDRYDMFNPFMQFVGDQAVFGSEVRLSQAKDFGYQMRYMEYKQRLDQCAGAFSAGVLPGYARTLTEDDLPETIDSDFLRSRVGEIDQFYSVLTGYCRATLFQFIVRVDNSITAHRPMAFAPTIL